MSAAAFTKLPFDEAIAFLRDKVRLPTETWTDLWHGMHSRGFVVAGGIKNAFLADVQESLVSALEDGTTFADFKKSFRDIVAKHGWTGSVGARHAVPVPGGPSSDRLGWRAGVIFQTNIATAYAAGHYQQMTDPAVLKARPYWRYIGGLSMRPRPLHKAWSGTILKSDDPWWDTHYPPNGWGCKCRVVSVGDREMQREGWSPSDKAPDDGSRDWTNPNTGAVETVPNGIDPGWAYNPGAAKWGEVEAGRLINDGRRWDDVDPLGPKSYGLPSSLPLNKSETQVGPLAKGEKALRQALASAVGGEEVLFTDPTGERVLVTPAIVQHMLEKKSRLDGREAYFPFIPELIEKPDEIWLNFRRNAESGRVDIRRRYVKGLDLGEGKTVGLVAEVKNNNWVGLTFFDSDLKGMGPMRRGRLVWPRKT